ncbi:MAG: amylo-alpha-1,6-glucosidase, partial [Bacteroidales bacterium]
QVKQVLLTPRGLRTLAPMDTRYKGVYQGSQAERDEAYHQGTVWVWLLGHYAQAYLKVYGQAGLDHIEKIYMNFENALHEQCVGSIAEIYDGDPPHKGKGAISQAWSVAELLRIKFLINTYKK